MPTTATTVSKVGNDVRTRGERLFDAQLERQESKLPGCRDGRRIGKSIARNRPKSPDCPARWHPVCNGCGAIDVLALWVIYRYEGSARWMPAGEVGQPPESARDLKDARLARYRDLSMTAVSARFLAAALGVLVFGFVVARAGERIAAQSGVGQSFVGATLVALATSLPEVSTTWSAVRFGAYSMAVANILGTNSIEVALFLPADVAYREGAIFDALPRSAGFLAALGIVCTAVYLWGILERRDRTVLGMGIDSAVVLLIYGSGLVVFYLLPT